MSFMRLTLPARCREYDEWTDGCDAARTARVAIIPISHTGYIVERYDTKPILHNSLSQQKTFFEGFLMDVPI